MSSHSVDAVRACLEHPDAPRAVRDYFGRRPSTSRPTHPGSRFDVVGNGASVSPDQITPDDLVAVGLLGHVVPPDVTLDLLEGDLASDLCAVLERVPDDLRLGDLGAVDRTGCPSGLSTGWSLLAEHPAVDDDLISTMFARKRPQLVPVMDGVVRCALGSPTSPSAYLHSLLAVEGGRLHDLLDNTLRASGTDQPVSTVRVIHVLLWMGHHREHLRTRCSGLRS